MNTRTPSHNGKRILFFVAHPIHDASCRYRIHQYLPYLEQSGFECTVSPFSTDALFQMLNGRGRLFSKVAHTAFCSVRRIGQIIASGAYDLVVIHREVFPFLRPVSENCVLRRNPRVIFSFDDAVYASHADVANMPHPWLYRIKYRGGIEHVLGRAIHVIAGNKILAGYASRFNQHVSVYPTVVDCSKYQFRLPGPVHTRPLTIGWMGSRSTAPYLTEIVPALRRLAEVNRGSVRFRIFGCPQYTLDLPDCESLPFRLATEMQDLAGIDIGIMPMPDTEWTRGKCAFKAIQYMALGTPVVASPVGITPEVVENNRTGLIAKDCDEWFHALNRLVNDLKLRQELAMNARKTIDTHYSIQVWGPRLASLFSELQFQHPKSSPAPRRAAAVTA